MTKQKKLKIGLDFHGVVDRQPEFFASFTQIAMQRGHQIHIITGGPLEEVCQKLNELGVSYSKVFAILDFYQAKGDAYWDGKDVKVPEELWNKAKADYCRKENINLHIDDSSLYNQWFTTPYCRYNQTEKNCQASSHQMVSFAQSAVETLNKIEKIAG